MQVDDLGTLEVGWVGREDTGDDDLAVHHSLPAGNIRVKAEMADRQDVIAVGDTARSI